MHTFLQPQVVHVVAIAGVVICSAAFIMAAAAASRARENVSRAVMADAVLFAMVGVFLTSALMRVTAVRFDIAMLAGLLGVLSTVGLARVLTRGRR
ncbi:MnhF protein [Corynebacterium sp. TAE3-ERU12]|uniref:MnhF protein n=1 Tax=Corynebacterium sp. TAE3-ERU12 TaxID=2849491 RepID=UPI001C436A0A|nr:MnhF protein [Corynebacterium sp. TAE3-ERU12]MBV7294463.1 MnhF protein [Corynebacterium sp. TAE3-ERU12]